jgi:DNA invertase Pin-like site-specific DNA recombinase
MNTSELVTVQHLSRKAIIYIRQSSPNQMISNQESLRLQYALKQRAIEFGWAEDKIEIIDHDLGMTGASAAHREGFKELLAQVTLGEVGIVLSFDVTRLSRNCSDWYPLLDLCGYKNCLIADRDGVYDPGSPNGRLLLGLKGQISEVELYTIRARLTAGLLNKAERGELALRLPTGLVRDELGVVHKEPNQEVQDRIDLIFQTFLQTKAASQVVRKFNEQELLIPRRNRFKDTVWRKPTVAAILSILKNPAYAGAFVYGRSRSIHHDSTRHKIHIKRLPIDEWKIRINDVYPAYISWETYEHIRVQLMDNYAEYDRNKTRGIPRPGAALLHGIVCCGECGHQMVVQYKNATRYICNYLRQQYQVPICQYIPAKIVDDYVVSAFFEALSKVELDAYTQAIKSQDKLDQGVERAHQQQLERLRYQAALAERQFNQVDPDNRLVAATLEKRWEAALAELQKAEAHYTQQKPAKSEIELSPELKTAFLEIGKKLPEVWQSDVLARSQKKSLLRCLIDKVVVHRLERDLVHTRIVWKGGDTTTVDLPIPVQSLLELSNGKELETRIVALAKSGMDDRTITDTLMDEGFRSPHHLSLLPSTVKRIRLQNGIMIEKYQSHPRRVPGYLTITQIANSLEVAHHWLYDRIHKGTITVERNSETKLYLFPDEPSTIPKFRALLEGQVQSLCF